jgi:hypothetical protein
VTVSFVKDYFTYLTVHGFYESDVLEDRVVFLFVFVPILRREIATFVETWNEHRIRSQSGRPNHIAGRPNELYFDTSASRYGWQPNPELLSQLKEAVSGFGIATIHLTLLSPN